MQTFGISKIFIDRSACGGSSENWVSWIYIDSKSNNEHTVGELDHGRCQQHPIVQSSSFVKDIQLQICVLRN